jgi:DNA modification methylase
MKLGRFDVPGYYVGDCRELLRELPDNSVHCVVSSPPYWTLRDYGLPPTTWGGAADCEHAWGEEGRLHKGGPHGDGVLRDGGRRVIEAQAATKDINTGAFCSICVAWRGQLGLEPTPDLYVAHMVMVFEEIRRVLKADGTCWVNLGDTYASNAGGYNGYSSRGESSWPSIGAKTMSAVIKGKRRTRSTRDPAYAGKHTAIVATGPIDQPNRRSVPGLKPKDLVGIPWRVALALQAAGWWLRDDIIWHKPACMPSSVTDRTTKAHEYVFLLSKSASYHYDADAIKEPVTGEAHARGKGVNPKAAGKNEASGDRRKAGFNERWRTKQNASFSAAVVELVEKRNKRSVWTIPSEPSSDPHYAAFPRKLAEPCILAGCPAGGLVLDPFGGSGTVGRVAEDLGRLWLLFDLSPEYARIAKRKTAQTGLLLRAAQRGA